MQVCSWGNYNSIVSQYQLKNDPFDPKANIYVGAHILKGKWDAIKGKGYCTPGIEETKCVIAAYNAGQSLIIGAANVLDKPTTWAAINQRLQDENFVKRWYPDEEPWTDTVSCGNKGTMTRRACKFANSDAYVAGIIRDYQSFGGAVV